MPPRPADLCAPRTRTRAGMALPWILGLAVILVIMGVTGSFQVSSARRTLERIYARRLLDITANSAFEEASARLEQLVPPIPVPGHSMQRQLQSVVSWPSEIEPVEVAKDAKADGITVGKVSIKSAPWVLDMPQHPPSGPVKISEISILDLAVRIKVTAGATTLDRTVQARRYMWMAPPTSAPTGGQCRLGIQSYNVVYQIKE